MFKARHRTKRKALPSALDPFAKFGSALLRHSFTKKRKSDLLTSVSRRLLFETLEPRVLLSADLNPIQGSIAVPGEIDRYTFTLSQEKQILFDSEINSSQLNWSLNGPQGSVVSARPFNSSDPVDNSTVAPLDLVAGNYILSVQGVADATGSYQFRLLDLANAPTILPGAPVAGTLNPGNATDLYQRMDANRPTKPSSEI